VSRHQHVGEGLQALAHVVLDDLVRKVYEEDRRFFFVDVEGDAADPSAGVLFTDKLLSFPPRQGRA